MSFAKAKKNFSFTKKASNVPPQPYFSKVLGREVTITFACVEALKLAKKSSRPDTHYKHFHKSFYHNNGEYLKIGESKEVWKELREKSEAELDAILKQKSAKLARKR